MLATLEVPASIAKGPQENMIQFKEVLEQLKIDANEGQAAAKSCHNRIKFLVESTDSNTKMFADLRKGEVKAYQKAKETFVSRITKYFDTRQKIESLELEIADLEAEIGKETLPDKQQQAAKLKLKQLHQLLLKTKVDYTQMKIDAKEISTEFNQTKHKFVRVFNAYAENVELRVRDNLAFFVQKVGDFLGALKLGHVPGLPGSSTPQSSRMLEEPITARSTSSTDFNQKVDKLSLKMAVDQFVIESIEFDEERISDPDLYLHFSNFIQEEPKLVVREINELAAKLPHKTSSLVFRKASDVVLGRSYISELITATSESITARSLGARVACFLIALKPKFGKLVSKTVSDATRDELLRGILGNLRLNRIPRVRKCQS